MIQQNRHNLSPRALDTGSVAKSDDRGVGDVLNDVRRILTSDSIDVLLTFDEMDHRGVDDVTGRWVIVGIGSDNLLGLFDGPLPLVAQSERGSFGGHMNRCMHWES